MKQQSFMFQKEITIVKEVRLPYLLSLPEGYDERSQSSYPLVLFLDGMGERGDNLKPCKRTRSP